MRIDPFRLMTNHTSIRSNSSWDKTYRHSPSSDLFDRTLLILNLENLILDLHGTSGPSHPISSDRSSDRMVFNHSVTSKTLIESSSWIHITILAVAMFSLSFITVLGNTIVIYALRTNRHLRTVGNLFILSLATADLIVGCFVMPIAGIYAIMEKWKMGLMLCQIWISVDYTASTASIFNLLTLSLDRYWSITSPLQYLGKRTRTRALFLIGFAWGLSLLWVFPIFTWHRFNEGIRYIEPDKCEPEYTHSKIFKVTTAIVNFYLPLLVLISLNGRIYYEIKRRYKNVLLQRLSTKMSEPTNTSFYTRKSPLREKNSSLPMTMTLCDSERQYCSTTINFTDNDSLVMSKVSAKSPNNVHNESILRINFKEKKARSVLSSPSFERPSPALKRTYSYLEKKHCTQDELTWLAQRREHVNGSSFHSPSSPPLANSYKYHSIRLRRLNTEENSFKPASEYHNCRIYTNKQALQQQFSNSSSTSTRQPYQTSSTHANNLLCRHCSVIDSIKTSHSAPTATMNVFNLCHCCSAATSAITLHSNPFGSHCTNTNMETFEQTRKVSSSSSSSAVHSPINRKATVSQTQSSGPALKPLKSNSSGQTSPLLLSNSQAHYRTNSKVKQSTVWNQQEKAFRQLFAIVFGFTCCFLPYFILYMVVAFCGSCVSERLVTGTVWLGYVNSTMNPFLYALSNKHFRRTFKHLLKRDNRRQSYYN